jgi:hypothetical protein
LPVFSRDFIDKGCTEDFEKAYEFVFGLTQEFGLSAERSIFVAGNHDVCDLREAYEWREKPDGLKEGEWTKQGDIILARNAEKYPLRLKLFSDSFFHRFVHQPYPLDCTTQGMAIRFRETGSGAGPPMTRIARIREAPFRQNRKTDSPAQRNPSSSDCPFSSVKSVVNTAAADRGVAPRGRRPGADEGHGVPRQSTKEPGAPGAAWRRA